MTPAPPRVGRSVFWIVLSRVAVLPLGLLQGALLARTLLPQGLGRYSALLVDANLCVAVLSVGLPGALSVLLGERAGRLRPLLRYGLKFGLVAIVLPGLALSTIAFLWPAAPAAVARLPVEIALVAVLCASQYARDVLAALLLGSQRFREQNLQVLVLQVVQLALCVLLIAAGRLTPRTAIGMQIVSNLLLCALQAHALRRVVPEGLWSLAEPDLGSRARRIGWRNFLHILPDLLLLRIDVYLIQELLPRATREAQLGIYQAGVRIAELVLLVPGALNTVLFAKAAAREEMTAITLWGAKLGLYLSLGCLLGMALVGQPLLILLFGPRFAGSFVPCLLVLLGCSALCFSGPLAGTVAGAGAYPRSIIVAQGVALLVNVGVNIVLIPRYGATGAAAASTVAYIVSAAILARAFAARFSVPMHELLRPESPLALIRRLRSH